MGIAALLSTIDTTQKTRRNKMQRLKAGVGSADITPPIGIEMGMWALRKGLCRGVHDALYARALVLDDGREPVAIVSLDVCAVSQDVTDRVRELVAQQVPIPEANILLNASHTHTTPYTARGLSPRVNSLTAGHRAYQEVFPHYVAGAIIEAWHQREDAFIGAASTTVSGITINRRNPTLPVDPQLGVIRVDGKDGHPLACLVNYACHGVAVGAHYLAWSADFPGYLARVIEDAEPGCTCLFLQGAEGDIHPWDWYFGNPNPRFGDTYEAAERLGEAIAGPALSLYQQIETNPSAETRVATSVVELPPRPIKWTAEEAESYLARLEATVKPYAGDVIPDNCPGCMSAQRFPDTYHLSGARHEAYFARNHPTVIAAELTALKINDIVLTAIPGELYHSLGVEIKQKSPVKNTFVLGCTNDWIGYLPVREAAEAVLDLPLEEFVDPVKHRQHYGATVTTEAGPGAGEAVVAETLHLIHLIGNG
jgi:neutral ceramidase